MRKKLLLISLLLILVATLSACITIKGPSQDTSATPSVTDENTQAAATATAIAAQTPAPTEGPTPTPPPTEEPTATPVPAETPVEENDAYITSMSMSMDGQTDITFDYVDWLSGEEAEHKYLLDHPGATEEDMEAEGIYEMGYIRNVNSLLRTFRTTPDTRYFLPDPMDMGENIEVSYDEFRDKMFPAVDMGIDEHLTFVTVTVRGEELLKIEWNYTP